MKKVFLLSLCSLLLTGNLFSQTINFNTSQDSLTQKFNFSKLSISDNKTLSRHKTSDKEEAVLAGAVIGAAVGVGIAAILGSFSLEPSNDKKASAPALILGGVFGGFIGAMVGDAIENE